MAESLQITKRQGYYLASFTAMASPCELLFDSDDKEQVVDLARLAEAETRRIEQKFSRYRDDNLMYRINNSQGKTLAIDEEAFRLLSFADICFQLSDGMFDITSGVLRKAWRFDGSDNLPDDKQVQALLPYIGWQHVQFNEKHITLPAGFELDFGGIGKEYAVDAVSRLCLQHAPELSVLVNFGGDIQVTRPRQNQQPWQVGIEVPDQDGQSARVLEIYQGGLATSGDARRYLLKGGIRYSHILNPKTGYPILNAPRAVTVANQFCTQAGLLATLALLQGHNAEAFLQQQGVTFWLQ